LPGEIGLSPNEPHSGEIQAEFREYRHSQPTTLRQYPSIPLPAAFPSLISRLMATSNPPRRFHRAFTATGLIPVTAAVLLLGGCGGTHAPTATAQEGNAPARTPTTAGAKGASQVPEATT